MKPEVHNYGIMKRDLPWFTDNVIICLDYPKESAGGFPGGTVVDNLPANAGDTGSSPGLGRSHMPRSDWAREPQLLSLRVWSLCSTTREAVIVRGPRTAMKSGPHLPQLEKALTQKRRPNTAERISWKTFRMNNGIKNRCLDKRYI